MALSPEKIGNRVSLRTLAVVEEVEIATDDIIRRGFTRGNIPIKTICDADFSFAAKELEKRFKSAGWIEAKFLFNSSQKEGTSCSVSLSY